MIRILAVDHSQGRKDTAPAFTEEASTQPRIRARFLNSSSIRLGLNLAISLLSVAASCAELPQAQVVPIPLKLSVVEAKDIRFAHISTAEGLSQIRVTNIVQDDLGYMWFGTLYGLNRFDGYTFKVYIHELGNLNSLSGVKVESLFKDRD